MGADPNFSMSYVPDKEYISGVDVADAPHTISYFEPRRKLYKFRFLNPPSIVVDDSLVISYVDTFADALKVPEKPEGSYDVNISLSNNLLPTLAVVVKNPTETLIKKLLPDGSLDRISL